MAKAAPVSPGAAFAYHGTITACGKDLRIPYIR
jgi:hypothetical protein